MEVGEWYQTILVLQLSFITILPTEHKIIINNLRSISAKLIK